MGNYKNPHVETDYDDRIENRREKLKERAATARDNSDALHKSASDKASVIPFGQPILVGHHSEGRDRRYRAGITRTFDKSFEEMDKAKHLDRKAASVGTGGISTNDPTALEQLKEKLDGLVELQEVMKLANRQHRKGGWQAVTGISETQKEEMIALAKRLNRDDKPFPSYRLSNNSANARNVRKRIAELEALRESDAVEHQGEGFTVETLEGRIAIEFENGKPTTQVRDLLKRNAFKWSRSRVAWVRKSTANAQRAAKQLITMLDEIDELYD